jgi:polyisoprenoid-binding protein YceI
MNRLIALLTFQLLAVITVHGQERLNADTSKTRILWLGEKVTGEHHGTISLKSGWITWQDKRIVSGEFEMDMRSLKDSENNEKLEGHLKSDDFFGVATFPVSKLVVTSSTPFDKGTGVVTGTLTIKGITNPIEFKATSQIKDDGLWFYGNIIIDRTKYNIRYGSGSYFDNLGDKTIFDEFSLKVSLCLKK